MSLTYLLNAAWMAVTSFCAMPIIVYLMLRSICANEIEHRDYWFLDNYCLNLSRFGSSDTFRVLTSVVEQLLHCALAVMQCIVIGSVCGFVVCLRVCYHDNSTLHASILTKLGL